MKFGLKEFHRRSIGIQRFLYKHFWEVEPPGAKEKNAPSTVMPILIGIPFDANSSYMRGAAGAPARIRESMHCDASNMWSEVGVDVGAPGAFADRGDLQLRDENAFAAIEQTIHGSLAE